MRLRRLLLMCWLPAWCALPAVAAATEPDLYREAMLAISEGRLQDAEKTLAALTVSEPQHAGAWLDLAMLYCATGNAMLAERFFLEIEQRFAPPPAILAVISQQRTQGCTAPQPAPQAKLYLGRGYESNVNQGALSPFFSLGSGSSQIDLVLAPEFRPQHDHFTQLTAEFSHPVSTGGASGVLQLQSKAYDRLNRYNMTSLFVGAMQPWRLGEGWFRAGGSLGLMTLDNELYLQQGLLQIELMPSLPLPAGWQIGAIGSLSRIDYPTLKNFDAQWSELRGVLDYNAGAGALRASAGMIDDRQLGNRPGGNRAGLFAGLQGSLNFEGGWVAEAGWIFQRWRGESAYFPGLIESRRQQDIHILRTALTVPLDKQHALQLEFRQVRNEENISIFAYRNALLQVNWLWQPGR